MEKVSFWKSFPINLTPSNIAIVDEELKPIGKPEVVMDKISLIPHVKPLPRTVSDLLYNPTLVKYFWDFERGVFLYFNIEFNTVNNSIIDFNKQKDDYVMVINANSSVSTKSLFKLYVQLFEHLEVVLLDEQTHKFFTPKDFRATI